MMRFSEIEKVDVIVNHINTELPFIVLRVNRTVEIFRFQEATILRTGKYPAKVIIADIKKIVITLQSITIKQELKNRWILILL